MDARLGPGNGFPDLILPDTTGVDRALSELTGGDPVVLNFYRGFWCPKEQAFFRRLVALQSEAEVAYTCFVSVSWLAFVPDPPQDALEVAAVADVSTPRREGPGIDAAAGMPGPRSADDEAPAAARRPGAPGRAAPSGGARFPALRRQAVARRRLRCGCPGCCSSGRRP